MSLMVGRSRARDHRWIGAPAVDGDSTAPRTRAPRPGAGRHGPTRSTTDRVLGGVAAGVARWLGLEPVIIRIAFVVFAVAGGFGVAVYAVLWAVLPDDRGTAPVMTFRADRGQRAAAFGMIVLGILLLAREVGVWLGDALVWPLVLAAVGLALIWPQARPGEGGTGGIFDGRAAIVRIGLGMAAVVAGIALFAVANTSLDALRDALFAIALGIGGLALIFGPWWWRLGRDLVEERRRRIRSEERAEMAARLHDSVLQTLALIQHRAAGDPEIARLARRQERELRSWLYEDAQPRPDTLAAAVADAVAGVEDMFGIVVEAVVVGDAQLDEPAAAVVDAAKEALVNAAKFAGVSTVSLYVEVEGDRLTGFVRDRGSGFDPGAVPSDRRGIADSIHARMARHGGSAEVRSVPGDGTEVELSVALASRRPA